MTSHAHSIIAQTIGASPLGSPEVESQSGRGSGFDDDYLPPGEKYSRYRTGRRRHDPLLENGTGHWRDTGCDVARSCFSCPLAACKYDDPTAYREQVRNTRDLEIVATLQDFQHKPEATAHVAELFGLSSRSVNRAVRRAAV